MNNPRLQTARDLTSKEHRARHLLYASTQKNIQARGIHMQRVTITGVFTIALLSGCAQPAGPRVPTTPVNLQCHVKNKDFGEIHIGLKETDVQFLVAGCNITKFIFVGNGHDPPPNFTETTKAGGPMVVYHYDGKNPIPDTPDTPGYKFTFVNDDKQDGNGSGVVKN